MKKSLSAEWRVLSRVKDARTTPKIAFGKGAITLDRDKNSVVNKN